MMISVSDVENWHKVTYLAGCWKAKIVDELVDGPGLWVGYEDRAWSSSCGRPQKSPTHGMRTRTCSPSSQKETQPCVFPQCLKHATHFWMNECMSE